MSYMEHGIYFQKTAKEVRKLIGLKIRYLCNGDIDRSGRGYIFPRIGTVQEVKGKNVNISGSWEWIPSMVEYEVISETQN